MSETLSPMQIAYGALWRLTSTNPTLHQARRELLDGLGGMHSEAQRQAISWAMNYFPPMTETEVLTITAGLPAEGTET